MDGTRPSDHLRRPDPGEASVFALIQDVVADMRHLILQEIRLAKDEMLEKVTTLQRIVMVFAGAFVVFLVAGALLIAMCVHLLHEVGTLPLWSCYAIVSGALAVLGGFLLRAGKRTLEHMTVLPTKTIETMKEPWPWMKKAQ